MCGPLSQSGEAIGQKWVQLTATHCSSLQHTATYYKHIRSQRVVLRLNQEKLLDKNGWSFLHPDEQVEILKDQLAQCPCFENLITSICWLYMMLIELTFEFLFRILTRLLTLQHTATHCNTLQHTVQEPHSPFDIEAAAHEVSCCVCFSVLRCVAVCYSVLQCAAVCCSVLQCIAVRCSVL